MPLEAAELFDPVLVKDLIDKVKGESALAILSNQEPMPFTGIKRFIFTLDNEIDLVEESGAKSHGGATVEPIVTRPVKVEYGARVSDEFMYATEEEQIDILKAFNNGFAKKIARGLDLMVFHGVNPRTGNPSSLIMNNCFDTLVNNVVQAGAGLSDPDQAVEDAIAMLNDVDVTGMIMAPAFRAALARLTNAAGEKVYPELAWGNAPTTINGLRVEVSRNVSDMAQDEARAYIGDFEGSFRWGYAKEIPMEIIEYGDPDNSGKDLKGHNQIYIRTEAYLGWTIFDPGAFAIIAEK